MTDTLFRIVFEGHLLEGVTLQTAKFNLAQLFNSDVSAVERLFTGQPVALKHGLSQPEAQRYLNALQEAGVQARIEPEPPINLSLDKVQALPPSAIAPQEPATHSPYAPPMATLGKPVQDSTLKVFSLHGRIGRLRYLAWSLVLVAAALLTVIIGSAVFGSSDIAGGLLIIATGIAFVVASIPMGVQRLHDIGWSGWLLLLNFVPLVGNFFPLLMVLMPGNSGPNTYGAPPPPNTRSVKLLASLWLAGIILMVLVVVISGIHVFEGFMEGAQVILSDYEQSLSDEQDNSGDNARPSTGQALKGGQSL